MDRPFGTPQTATYYDAKEFEKFMKELTELKGEILDFECNITYHCPMTDREFEVYNKNLKAQAEITQAKELKLLKKLLEKYPDART